MLKDKNGKAIQLPDGQCCGRCKYWGPFSGFGGNPACRKDTPKVAIRQVAMQPSVLTKGDVPPDVGYEYTSYFPPMRADDWGCGSFSADESQQN